MTTLSENHQWARQKQEVVQGFIDERRKLVSTVAGRGFLLAPGFLYEFETGLEINAKQKLSAVSYAILKEAVERDLKQYGLDMDIAFKTAAMTWELEKQSLLDDWNKELQWVKKGWADKEASLDQLAVEVSRRGITLLEAKTAIELEAEGLRARLAGIEDDSADKEVELAQQRLLTANKKLEVIPILQQILGVEQDIIAAERSIIEKDVLLNEKETEKVEALTDLLAAEEEISTKKEEDLFPVMQDLISKTDELVTATREQIANEILIMRQKVLDAEIMVEKAEKQVLIVESQMEEETARLALVDAKIALAAARRGYDLAVRRKETESLVAVTVLEEDIHNAIMVQESGTQSNVVNLKTEIAGSKIAQDVLSSGDLAANSVGNTIQIANYHADAVMTRAHFDAISEITAKLTHLIG